MLRKIILVLAAIALIAVAFIIVQWRDEPLRPTRRQTAPVLPPIREMPDRTARSQPANAPRTDQTAFSFRDTDLLPGESPRIRVYDEKGNARIVVQSEQCRPISNDEFHLSQPTARLLLPREQIAYVRADEGQVRVLRGDGLSMSPKSGWFRGHVCLFIDRSTADWRKAHPELAEPEQHPEKVVKIWLEGEVSFDMDFARLECKGPIRLQSKEGSIEGEGLLLEWDEVQRVIKRVVINRGEKATLRLTDLSDLRRADKVSSAPAADTEAASTPIARAEKPSAQQTEDERKREIQFLEPDELAREEEAKRIRTYRISFQDNVLAEQREGIRLVSRIQANLLELLRDFSPKEMDPAIGLGTTRPAAETQPGETKERKTDDLTEPAVEKTIVLRWSGPLVIEPTQEQPAAETDVQRTHLLARGDPVRVTDPKAGTATCHELEYHDETRQVWLRGTAAAPFVMQTRPEETLSGEVFTLDWSSGIARVEGSGRLRRHKPTTTEKTAGAEMPAPANLFDQQDDVDIRWQSSAELHFGRSEAKEGEPAPSFTEVSAIPAGTYIKRAVFLGNPSFAGQDQSIAAHEEIEVLFREPHEMEGSSNAPGLVADRVLARGRVRMSKEQNSIGCERLDVNMTVDELGNNVPLIGHAYGAIAVDLTAGKNRLRIKADDDLVASFISRPKRITLEQIAQIETRARAQGYTPDSPEWKENETRLRNRREPAITRMVVKGNVAVQSFETRFIGRERELDLQSNYLECHFAEDDTLERAWVRGTDETPAHVDTGDFFIRGGQIRLDMPTESVEVPGAGLLRLETDRDLDGARLDETVPIVITWQKSMNLNGQQNIGIFSGDARATSRDITATGRDLRVEFENLPRPTALATRTPEPRQRVAAAMAVTGMAGMVPLADFETLPTIASFGRFAGPLFKNLRGKTEKAPVNRLTRRVRKRPLYIKLVGDAVVTSHTFRRPEEVASVGPIHRMLMDSVFGRLSSPAAMQPTDRIDPQRTLSLVRVAGPQIAVNLRTHEEYLMVEGIGNLLILDYRLPQSRKDSAAGGADTLTGSLSPVSFGDSGPSQTLFSWRNSMTFLNNRNAALFEHGVEMVHVSGANMVRLNNLQEIMNLDDEMLKGIESREVEMSCENFMVEFDRVRRSGESGPSPLSRVTMLKGFEAKGGVVMKADERQAEGDIATYNNETGTVTLRGTALHPPQILQIDPKTGQAPLWTGQSLEWNMKSQTITVHGSSILAPGTSNLRQTP